MESPVTLEMRTMFILNSVGSTILRAEEKFMREVAPAMGLENPFKRKHRVLASMFKEVNIGQYKRVPDEELDWSDYPTEAECDHWEREQNHYVAEQVLLKHGWAELQKFAENRHVEEVLQSLLPCEAESGQCHMDCKFFGRCNELWGSLKESQC